MYKNQNATNVLNDCMDFILNNFTLEIDGMNDDDILLPCTCWL